MNDQLSMQQAPEISAKLDELAQLALGLGASGAKIIPASEIVAEDHLAALCKETRCPNYGTSPTCPPNVNGPEWFREQLKESPYALVLRLDLPDEVMYSDQRREVHKLLHFYVIQVEQAAKEMGFSKAQAFAGGSCKNLFCHDEAKCNVLYGDGQCRNPDMARPSISGFGINTNSLLKAAGWDKSNSNEKLNTRLGLVLLG